MRAVLALVAVGLLGCASAPKPAPKRVVPKPQPIIQADVLPNWQKPSERASPAAKAKQNVQVQGIEGTLHSFDVKVTMEQKTREFAACHEPRARRVPILSGSLEFGIQVEHTGTVLQVDLRTSDVGDRELERCFVEVIRATQFPKPNGGDANVTYTMLLAPGGKAREPEQWGSERVQHLLDKRGADLSEQCELPRGGDFTITAYVNKKGRVVAAGVTTRAPVEASQFDCISKALKRWPMPKPHKKRFAKVTFPLRATRQS